MSKQEVICRDNWITLLNRLGDAGKDLRVAANNRIIKKTKANGTNGGASDRGAGNSSGANGSGGAPDARPGEPAKPDEAKK